MSRLFAIRRRSRGSGASSGTAPNITGSPSIIGTPTEGVAVSYTPASVTGSPTPTRTQQWTLNGSDISGATGSTYTPVTGDVGDTLAVRQIETNVNGSDNETSSGATVSAAGNETITAGITASATSGYGPLDVLFEGNRSTSSSISDLNFTHQVEYLYDFGRSTGATWPYSSKSKDSDSGVRAQCVFEPASGVGTVVYTVTMTATVGFAWVSGRSYRATETNGFPAFVRQGGNTYRCIVTHTAGTFATDLSAGRWQLVTTGHVTDTVTVDITVTDQDTYFSTGGRSTYCFKDGGDPDSGGPAGATYVTSMPSISTVNGHRLLVKHSKTGISLPVATGSQSVCIGTYGGSSKPTVTNSYAEQSTGRVVVENMTFHSQCRVYNAQQSLFFRCLIRGDNADGDYVNASFSHGSGTMASDNRISYIECEILCDRGAEYGFFTDGASRQVAIVGCLIDTGPGGGSSGTHCYRARTYRHLIAHNWFRTGGTGRHLIKMHGVSTTRPSANESSTSSSFAAEQAYIGHNRFGSSGSGSNAPAVAIEAENSGSAGSQDQADIVVEDNDFILTSGGNDINRAGMRITIRGNRAWSDDAMTSSRSLGIGIDHGGASNGPYYTA